MPRRNFKDPMLKNQYEGMLNMSQESFEICMRKGGSIQAAFAWGYEGGELIGIHCYDKKSPTYAAYCAGKDRAALDRQNSGITN